MAFRAAKMSHVEAARSQGRLRERRNATDGRVGLSWKSCSARLPSVAPRTASLFVLEELHRDSDVPPCDRDVEGKFRYRRERVGHSSLEKRAVAFGYSEIADTCRSLFRFFSLFSFFFLVIAITFLNVAVVVGRITECKRLRNELRSICDDARTINFLSSSIAGFASVAKFPLGNASTSKSPADRDEPSRREVDGKSKESACLLEQDDHTKPDESNEKLHNYCFIAV